MKVMSNLDQIYLDDSRIVYPESSIEIVDRLKSQKNLGKYVCAISGSFDVPHPGHKDQLRCFRELVAERILQEDDTVSPTSKQIQDMVFGDQIFLMAVLDSNARLASRKGRDPTKGGAPRPIYDWSARAQQIAGYMVYNGSTYRPLADLVTVADSQISGLDCCDTFVETQQDLINYYGVTAEHPTDVATSLRIVGENRTVILPAPRIIDPLTNEPYSSSEIVKRARS